MKCSVYKPEQFSDFIQEWNQLNEQTQSQAILDADFVQCLIKHFFSGHELLLLVHQDNHIAFIGFFEKCGFGRWQSVMPSQAPLGLWLSAQHKVSERLLLELTKALPGLVLQLDLLQADSRQLQVDKNIHQQFYIETGNRPIPVNYDDFAKTIGKNLRQNCNKAYNRAERDNNKLEATVLNLTNDISEGVLRYADIESKSWKAKEGTAISAENTQGKFYHDMMTSLAQRNAASVWYFLVSGEVAAVDLCVIKGGNLIILKTTFDEQYAQYSPALLLKLEMIKYYASRPELGISNIEFYGKAMDWHKRLNSELRPIFHLSWQRTPLLRWLVRKIKHRHSSQNA